jgi:hypothetical protein
VVNIVHGAKATKCGWCARPADMNFTPCSAMSKLTVQSAINMHRLAPHRSRLPEICVEGIVSVGH